MSKDEFFEFLIYFIPTFWGLLTIVSLILCTIFIFYPSSETLVCEKNNVCTVEKKYFYIFPTKSQFSVSPMSQISFKYKRSIIRRVFYSYYLIIDNRKLFKAFSDSDRILLDRKEFVLKKKFYQYLNKEINKFEVKSTSGYELRQCLQMFLLFTLIFYLLGLTSMLPKSFDKDDAFTLTFTSVLLSLLCMIIWKVFVFLTSFIPYVY